MGFTRQQLASFQDASVPDLLPGERFGRAWRLRLLFVGINPSLWTAATGAHFARPGNRFYPALAAAGITDHVIDASAGYRPDDLAQLQRLGIGNTNLVARATARADQLSDAELRAGRHHLFDVVATHRPPVVAVLGVTAYRVAFGVGRASVGEQPQTIDSARLFVLPNPSGLNAHETVASLAAWYRRAWEAAHDAEESPAVGRGVRPTS